MKRCTQCGLEKPATAFDSNGKRRRGKCRRCRKGKPPATHGGKAPRASAKTDPGLPEFEIVVEAPAKPPPKLYVRPLAESKRYLITAAQNATPVHLPFLATLKAAAAHLNAELVIIPLRYKNPTSQREANTSDDWWAPEVEPYLFDGRKHLNRSLVLVADVKSQPTTVSPLAGFDAITGAESCIIGHPKMELRAVPVPSGSSGFPKLLTTTGACTERNYSDTRAGKLGEFHHFLGGLVVEIQDDKFFHLRQLNASREDGSFIDLDTRYTPDGAQRAPPALGLVMGDTHVRVTDRAVDLATFARGGIVDTLQPQTLVFHDLSDGETHNPHDGGNPFVTEAKRRADRRDVESELREVVRFVNARAHGRDVVIVDSNHHDFLNRWLQRTDWRQDLKNARFYLRTALATLESAGMTPAGPEYMDPFPHALRELGLAEHIRCLGPDESCTVGEVEVGLHGHRGPNGSKGTLRNLSRLGVKTVTGHSHTPGIREGAYAVGTSTPRRLHYAHGPGSWLNTHCAIYGNGKRALINIIEGAWRLVEPTPDASVASDDEEVTAV